MTFSLNIKTAADLAKEAKVGLRNQIRQRRNQALASGITIGGITVHTDDVSQNRIVGAALAATLNPETMINWKCADGSFLTLDAATIIAVAQAVRTHVQSCFDREDALLNLLEADEPYDIDAGWPT